MSKFDELMDELQTLAKAQPAGDGDEKIVAAAADGGGQDAVDGGEGAGEGVDDGDADMAKSFEVTLPDGSKVQAQDGTAMVKALQQRLETNEEVLGKALEQAVGLIKAQGERIEKLSTMVKSLSEQGRGRKAVLSVTEKPAAGTELKKSQSEGDGIQAEVFMAKALDAQKMGRITGIEVATAEAYLNRGQQVPANIVSKVLTAG